MAVDYKILDYTVKALVEQLMSRYKSSFDSSLEMVLNSQLYARLLENAHLLEEGDIYLFQLLVKELKEKGLEETIK
ncbi:MAG: hypothetical protein K6E86_01850 [Bacteroidales bacterium]|nr:hypothetical protein [Bacteroidales bacterium]